MRALRWRTLGQTDQTAIPAANSTAVAAPASPARPRPAWIARVIAVEPALAAITALVLLLAPNPLVWPAAVLGVVPSVVRLAFTGRPWRATPFDVPLLLLAVGALLGGYASLSVEGAQIRLTGLLAAAILFAALREHAQGERTVRRIVLGSLVGTVLATLLLLVLVGPFLLLERLPLLAAGVQAIDRGGYGAWFVDQDWLLQRYRFRASGVGALADVGLALAVAALVGLRGRASRVAGGLTIPLFVVALIVADNRGSMLAGVLTLGMMATVWRRRLLALAPVVAALAVLVVAFGPSDRGLSLKTLAQRFWFWENSLYLAKEVPMTGAGLGLESVQLVYRGYFLPAYPPFSHAHNIYLQGLLEYGVIGLLGLIGLGAATLWVGWRVPAGASRWTMAGILAGFGVAMAMFTSGLTEIVLHSTLGGVLAIAALGLLAAARESARTIDRGNLTRSAPSPLADLTPPAPLAAGERGGNEMLARVAGADRERELPVSPSPARRGGWGVRLAPGVRFVSIAAGLAVLAAGLVVSGLSTTIAARLLLNDGTANLNRAAFSESIGRQERSTALNRATNRLRFASTLAPTDPTIQRNLALVLALTDEAREARSAADRSKALIVAQDGGGSAADLLQLGRAYVAVSNWGEAIRAWQAANAAPQLIQIGNRLIRLRNVDQAINAFIATARVDPSSRSAYDGVTRAARERKSSPDEIVGALGPLMQPGAPTAFGAHLEAGRVLREAGRMQDGIRQLEMAEQISAPPELSFEYGRVWMTAGVALRAEPLLVRPTADLPYEAESWLWYARALAALNRHEEAVATIRQGLSHLDPSGQFAPPAERLPETAAVRAVEIRRSERAPLLGVLGESLIQLGRAEEAIPALDEAVAAAPKDAWLAATRAEARAAQAGSAPNLLLNGSFDREGSWSLRERAWPAQAYWRLPLVLNEAPTFDEGHLRLAPPDPTARVVVQDVYGLDVGRRYRLTLRVRVEGASDSDIVPFMTQGTSADTAEWRTEASVGSEWATVTVEGEAGADPTGPVTVGIGFAAGTRHGSVIWCDEATLLDVTEMR